jgi:hypothetical protein
MKALYKAKNRAKAITDDRRWRSENRDKTDVIQQRWRDKNPGLAAQRTAEWREKNREKALEAQKLANRKLKEAAYNAYGGFRCNCCGETTEAFLTIDHVNNDGAQHRKEVRIRAIYKWLQVNDYPEGFQILCYNCNIGKHRNKGVCPHHQEKFPEGSETIPQGSTLQAIGSGSAGLLETLILG